MRRPECAWTRVNGRVCVECAWTRVKEDNGKKWIQILQVTHRRAKMDPMIVINAIMEIAVPAYTMHDDMHMRLGFVWDSSRERNIQGSDATCHNKPYLR